MVIKDLEIDNNIQITLLCTNFSEASAKGGKLYRRFNLCDSTGSIEGVMWDLDTKSKEVEAGDIVEVTGKVTSYNNNKQVTISSIVPNKFADPDMFYPKTDKDIDVMMNSLMLAINQVKDASLNRLLNHIYVESSYSSIIRKHSGSSKVHHAFVGGYLEHIMSMTVLVCSVSDVYTWLNRDLLITSSLLHDIGKLVELTPFPTNSYSDRGKLLGHISIAMEIVTTKARELDIREDKIIDDLLHCILAHHGKLEFGSPITPKLPEAMALHLVDMMDSKLEIFKEAIVNLEDGVWSSYNKYLGGEVRR